MKLLATQERILKIILHVESRTSSELVFEKLKCLPVRELYSYYVLIFVSKFIHNLLPSTFTGFYTCRSELNLRSTCNKNLFYTPKVRLISTMTSLTIYGPKIWQILPESIHCSNLIGSFKFSVKHYLRNKYTRDGLDSNECDTRTSKPVDLLGMQLAIMG